MKTRTILTALLATCLLAATAGTATASTSDAALKAQLRTQKLKVAKLTGQLALANGQVVKLKAQVSAQAAGGLQAILAGSPDDMWSAVAAIWQVFPQMPDASYCGFSKDTTTLAGTGLNIAHFTFSNYTNCS